MPQVRKVPVEEKEYVDADREFYIQPGKAVYYRSNTGEFEEKVEKRIQDIAGSLEAQFRSNGGEYDTKEGLDVAYEGTELSGMTDSVVDEPDPGLDLDEALSRMDDVMRGTATEGWLQRKVALLVGNEFMQQLDKAETSGRPDDYDDLVNFEKYVEEHMDELVSDYMNKLVSGLRHYTTRGVDTEDSYLETDIGELAFEKREEPYVSVRSESSELDLETPFYRTLFNPEPGIVIGAFSEDAPEAAQEVLERVDLEKSKRLGSLIRERSQLSQGEIDPRTAFQQ